MRLSQLSSDALSLARVQAAGRAALWRCRALLRQLLLMRQRFVRGLLFGVAGLAGAALLAGALLAPPPGAAEPAVTEPVLATEIVDQLTGWREERAAAQDAGMDAFSPDVFMPRTAEGRQL